MTKPPTKRKAKRKISAREKQLEELLAAYQAVAPMVTAANRQLHQHITDLENYIIKMGVAPDHWAWPSPTAQNVVPFSRKSKE